MSDDELITVFAGTYVEANILKSRLDAEGVTSFLKDNFMGLMVPFFTTVGGVNPIKIIISKYELEKAKPIIEDFLNKMKS